jgi:hypothetical protein
VIERLVKMTIFIMVVAVLLTASFLAGVAGFFMVLNSL